MFLMTLVHFSILSFRGGALYNYYHHYADKAAMYDWLASLHLTAPPLQPDRAAPGGILESLGYIVHGDQADLTNSNVADVVNSIINMLGTGDNDHRHHALAGFARRFGKKAVAVVGFALLAISSLSFYLLRPTNVSGMVALTILIAIVYAPTIPLVWAIYADVADYSEWKTGRRFTGMVFATIGFALKSGLALGSSAFSGSWSAFSITIQSKLQPRKPSTASAFAAAIVAVLFAICTVLLMCYKLNKRMTIQMADELAERRKKFATAEDTNKYTNLV